VRGEIGRWRKRERRKKREGSRKKKGDEPHLKFIPAFAASGGIY